MMRHLLLSGGPGHPFEATSSMVESLLDAEGFSTEIVTEPAEVVDRLRAADRGADEPIALLTVNALRWRMTQERFAAERSDHARTLDQAEMAAIDRYVRTGGGLLALHTAVICFDADPVWHRLCGASWNWDRSSHPPLAPLHIDVSDTGLSHPLTRGEQRFVVNDEHYRDLDMMDDVEALLVCSDGGPTQPVLWARAVDRGRVVTDLLGHDETSFEQPAHRRILARAATWASSRTETTATATASGTPT